MSQTSELLTRLERHYIKPGDSFPGGIFVPECGWNGGGTSRADALYVGFTGSSGRQLIGHELKVSRADWRRELDKPGKADQWADQCHAWYVVAPSTTIVKPEEIPAGWGLLVPSPRSTVRMDVVVQPVVHHDRHPSWNAVRSLLARQDTLRVGAIAAARLKDMEDAEAKLEARVEMYVQQRLRGTADGDAARRLAAVTAALGLEVRDDFAYANDEITLAELRAGSAFLRAHRDVQRAAAAFQRRYTGGTDALRKHADRLDQAVAALSALAGEDSTLELDGGAA